MKIADFIKFLSNNTDANDNVNFFFADYNLRIPICEKDIDFATNEVDLVVRD